jgi:S-adenosylmethionine hydrolase
VSIITLTTDFGVGSPYVASMKGVILSLNPQAVLVDITHAVPPQDVQHGAHALAEGTRYFPPGAIHIAVVDPGVGTQRGIIFASIGRQRYIAPDNGLLSLVAKQADVVEAYSLTFPQFWLPNVSNTFHGRDIMAPVAAHISLGLDPRQLGPRVDRIVELSLTAPRVQAKEVLGEVAFADSFGNLITNITPEVLRTAGIEPAQATILCGGQRLTGIQRAYADVPAGACLALLSSNGYLEIAVANGNAAESLQLSPGAAVVVLG